MLSSFLYDSAILPMIGLAFANNPHMAVEVFHCLQDHLRDFDLFKGCQELHREFMMLLTMFDQVS